MDVLTLSRLQFAATISFHYIYPPLSIGLFYSLCGAWQAGAFLVVSVSAWYLLKKRHLEFARASLRVGLVVSLIASLLQLVSGHDSAVGVAKNQPAKLAAFEGLYDTTTHAPLSLFGWVDEKSETVLLLFAVFVYLLNDKIQHGPDDADLTPSGKLAMPFKP